MENVLRIIFTKEVNIQMLQWARTVADYNTSIELTVDGTRHRVLTEPEFTALKEAEKTYRDEQFISGEIEKAKAKFDDDLRKIIGDF